MSFGDNIGYYRKKLKITQEELAERLYVSRQTVSRWETDSTFPDIDTVVSMCDLFGCDMDTLVRGDARSAGGEQVKKDKEKTECLGSARDYHLHMAALLRALCISALGLVSAAAFMIAGGVVSLLINLAIFLLITGTGVSEYLKLSKWHLTLKEGGELDRRSARKLAKGMRRFCGTMIGGGVLVAMLAIYSFIYLLLVSAPFLTALGVFLGFASVAAGLIFYGVALRASSAESKPKQTEDELDEDELDDEL